MCFAFLSSHKPGASQLLKFTDSIRKVRAFPGLLFPRFQIVSPALLCNRRFFFKSLTDMKTFIEHAGALFSFDRNIIGCSGTPSDHLQNLLSSPVTKHKYQSVADQAEKMYPRVHQLFSGLTTTGSFACPSHYHSCFRRKRMQGTSVHESDRTHRSPESASITGDIETAPRGGPLC